MSPKGTRLLEKLRPEKQEEAGSLPTPSFFRAFASD